MTTIIGTVSTATQLNTAVNAVAAMVGPGDYEIDLAPSIALTTPPTPVGLQSGVSLVLAMQGNATIDAAALSSSGAFAYPLANFGVGHTIDLAGVGGARAASLGSGGVLTVSGMDGGVLALLRLAPGGGPTAGQVYGTADDGAGGTNVTVRSLQTSYVVGSAAQLNAALSQIDLGGSDSRTDTAYTITLANGFALDRDLFAINLADLDTLTIQGNGATLDGGGAHRGLFDYAGAVVVNALTIAHASAVGGAGGNGAGGGAGLGGGLFVGAAGSVTLNSVNFVADGAGGGAGGDAGGTAGGGGGLGGAGGLDGGGGIGTAANASNAAVGQFEVGGLGGLGIVLGVPQGIDYAINGGAGSYGGGGGVGNAIGVAGFGGGATGDAFSATNGGFGGGGALANGNGPGGGGFGGGGGGNGAGGFGAGDGTNGGGGGGMGAGGDVFVQQGGQLTIGAGSLGQSTVAGGAGGGGAAAGQAAGGGIFLQGFETATLAPGAGKTLSVAGGIDEQTGTGAAALVIGAGTVMLRSAGDYSGGTTLAAGATLEIAAAGAAGSGPITFAGSATLRIDAAAMAGGNGFGAPIVGFDLGDTIDLFGMGTAASATLGAGNLLTLSGGSVAGPITIGLATAPLAPDEVFTVASDGNGGTTLRLSRPQPPASCRPFASLVASNPNASAILRVVARISPAVSGTLGNRGGGVASSDGTTFTMAGTVAQVNAALQAVVFTAVAGLLPTTYSATLGASDGNSTLTDTAAAPVTLVASAAGDKVVAGAGADTLVAAAAGTIAVGGSGTDVLIGDSIGATTLVGGSGNAAIYAKGGPTLIFGGSGRDTISAATGAVTVVSGGGALIDLGSGPATVFALAGDTVVGGNGAALVIAAANTLTRLGSGDAVVFAAAGAAVVGGSGADLVVGGSAGGTSYVAGSGPSTFFNVAGLGTVTGGLGAETVVATGSGGVRLGGGSGPTLFFNGSGSSTVRGGAGSVTVVGGAGGGLFAGGTAGNNLIIGGQQASTLIGGGSGDSLYAEGSANTPLLAGSGNETLNASDSLGSDTLFAGSGANVLALGGGPATVVASTGNASVLGGGGPDLVLFQNGHAGGVVDLFGFKLGTDAIGLLGYGPTAAADALATATLGSDGLTITLADATRIVFVGAGGIDGRVFG